MMRFVSMCWWILLATWFLLAVAPAITAISAFANLQELGLSVEGYEAYLGDDSRAQGRLAAGFVTDPVFRITDMAQIAVIIGVVLALAISRGRPSGTRSPANGVVIAFLVIAIILHGVLLLGFLPRMNNDLEAYRAAAKSNNAQLAEERLASFNSLHPTAERLYGVRALAVFGMIAASGFASGQGRKEQAT